jgi:ubiquinone/menaquinone biosynthesis C-methylase UbiE
MKDAIYRLAPESARSIYHHFKKTVMRGDVHVRIDATSISHVARYIRANEAVAGRDVLDAACGSGYGSNVLHAAASYRGLDLDKRAIREARRWFPGVDFVEGSVYDLPTETESVGAITSFETLEHIEQPERAMAEFARVLRPGGVFVGSIPINHPDRIHHVRPYSAVEAYDIFTGSTGLKVVDVSVQGAAFAFAPLHDYPKSLANAAGTLLVTMHKAG